MASLIAVPTNSERIAEEDGSVSLTWRRYFLNVALRLGAMSGGADGFLDTNGTVYPVDELLNPVGIMAPFGGTVAPEGWLLCDGSAVSRTVYSALFAVLGVRWGIGDGGTTFNLPNYTPNSGVALSGLTLLPILAVTYWIIKT